MLKTDYKDAMYDGARKYRITANTDGTSVIADETVYTQEEMLSGQRISMQPIWR